MANTNVTFHTVNDKGMALGLAHSDLRVLERNEAGLQSDKLPKVLWKVKKQRAGRVVDV